jgi:hypothetical protein
VGVPVAASNPVIARSGWFTAVAFQVKQEHHPDILANAGQLPGSMRRLADPPPVA